MRKFFPGPHIIIFFIFLWSGSNSIAQNYVFAQLSGSPVNTIGWNLQGGARVGNITGTSNQEVIVCPSNSPSGAIFFNQPINLSLCNKWKAEFDFRLFDGTGADGLAFCFLQVPPSGFVTGGGLGIPVSANGLKVCFDTWNNCIPFNAATVHDSMPKIEIRYGVGYSECSSQPTVNNIGGTLNFIRSANYHHALIQYNNGNIQVAVDGVIYLSGFQVFDFAGYLGFTASTGGYNDNHSIKNVIIYTEMPPSVAGPSVSFCPNGFAQLGTSNNPEYHYEWTSAIGLNATDISNPIVHLDNPGAGNLLQKYYVRTSFISNPGCTSVDSVTVLVRPKPKIAFITPAICLKDAFALFKDSSFTADPTGYPLSYNWNFGDPFSSASNPNTNALPDPTHIYSAAQNYNVQLKVTTANGCYDSLSKIFTVNGAFPKAGFTIINQPSICSNNEVKIQNISTVNFGSITRTEIWWDVDGLPGNIYIDSTPTADQQYRHLYPLFYGNSPRNFHIRMRVFSGRSCMDEVQKEIIVYPLPYVIFNPLPQVCQNVPPFIITGAFDSSKNPGSGYFLGSGIDSAGHYDPAIAKIGENILTYTYTTDHGCSDSAKSSITVWPLPKINIIKDVFVLEGGSTILQANASGMGLVFLWSPSTFLDDARILQPRTTPISDIKYTLKVTGTGGCESTDTVLVKVLNLPSIPNTFTPNGDGINDKWEIKYLDSYRDCTVDVFNRFGQHVYHSVGYNSAWNGTFNGNPLPFGTYYYVINPKMGRKIISGYVTIIR